MGGKELTGLVTSVAILWQSQGGKVFPHLVCPTLFRNWSCTALSIITEIGRAISKMTLKEHGVEELLSMVI